MSYWAVALTKSNLERTAVEHLIRQGFEAYLPLYTVKTGKITKIKPLFPRYVFIQIVDRWHSINGTRGISRLLLTNENKPATIATAIIDELKSREDSKGCVVLLSQERFKQGENVTLAAGAFEGYTGIYSGMRDSERVRVLIELLGRRVMVEVNETDLNSGGSVDRN